MKIIVNFLLHKVNNELLLTLILVNAFHLAKGYFLLLSGTP